MPKRSSDYHAWLLNHLTDSDEAAAYLNAAIEDSTEMFLKALRNVAEARGMAKVAEEAGRARESLYRTLSEEGNPRLDTLTSVLEVLGLRIAVEPAGSAPSTGGILESETSPSIERQPRNAPRISESATLNISLPTLTSLWVPSGTYIKKTTAGSAALAAHGHNLQGVVRERLPTERAA